jgi:hypothetical protein
MGMNAIGQHKAMSAQEKADAARKAAIQAVVDENYATNKAYQDQITGSLSSIMAGASGPQTTTNSSWQNSNSDSTQSMDFGPEGNAAAGDVLTAARNAPFEVNNLLAEQKAAAERDLASQGQNVNRTINNQAARMGVNPSMMKVGATQALNAQRLANNNAIGQKSQDNRRQAFGDLTSVLKNLYQRTNTKQTQNSRGGGTTTGGPDYGTMLAALRAGSPVNKEVVV